MNRNFFICFICFYTLLVACFTLLGFLTMGVTIDSRYEKYYNQCRGDERKLKIAIIKAHKRIEELNDFCLDCSSELYIIKEWFELCSCRYDVCMLGVEKDCKNLW